MYSNKTNINILTSLLLEHGIKHAVVCPGSRNAPVVHNLHEAGIVCHAVTDERSAGFYALGMALHLHAPVAVCVTSGTAVSNLLPAVTEAFYRHAPIIILSADRPSAWINQLDGQTINQLEALRSTVLKVVNLPEPSDETSRWHCNRLVNEALLECSRHGGGPVQINIPISEPLYEFTCESLPEERVISRMTCSDVRMPSIVAEQIARSQRPMIIIGQTPNTNEWREVVGSLVRKGYVVLGEVLSPTSEAFRHADEMVALFEQKHADYTPDLIIYAGESLISKRLKQWLRSLEGVPFWRISEDGSVEDVSTHLTGIIESAPEELLLELPERCSDDAWLRLWKSAYCEVQNKSGAFALSKRCFHSIKAVLSCLKSGTFNFCLHSANSLAVRLVQIFNPEYVYCNRGTNGIEGSLSTAAGHSLVTSDMVIHLTGDLSFFYDQNALWNQELRGNLRILLLNNGGGGIFSKFEGLKSSPVRESFVMAEHSASAEGICLQNNIRYRIVTEEKDIQDAAEWLLTTDSTRPVLLEVMTDKEEDMQTLKEYFENITQ